MIRTAPTLLLAGTLLAGCGAPVVVSTPAPAPSTEQQAARGDGAPGAAVLVPTPPAPGPAPALQPPTVMTRTLANGLRVMYVPRAGVPAVQATLLTRGGLADEPAALPGLAAFTASMLDEGAGGRGAIELANALDLLGASLSVSPGWDAARTDLYVLSRNFPQALRLMADVATRPDFPAREVERLRSERLVNLARAKDEPGAIAGNAFQTLVFGAANPYGRVATTEATRRITRDDLVRFHRGFYRPDQATLILVGDVSPEALQPAVEAAFGAWRPGASTALAPPLAPAAPTLPGTTIYLVDKPGAAQSEIRIGHPGVARNTPDYFPLLVMNSLLGGSFTSRLNQNLREEHGYTYGARSGYAMRRGAGPFVAQAAVKTAQTDSALIEFFKELNRIRTEPIPADELERAKRYVALGFPQQLETTRDVAQQIAALVQYDLPLSTLAEFVPRVTAVTAEDVRRVANQYVRPGNAVVVVVGDRAVIEPGIRALNLGRVEIREVGEFVK